MTLITTVAGTDSNAYISVADADTYFLSRVGGTAWAGYSNAQKETAILHATRLIDSIPWGGVKYDDDQALEFPRYSDGAIIVIWDEDSSDNVIIPLPVEYGCAECAYWLQRNDGEDALSQTATRGVTNASLGDASFSNLSRDIASVVGPEASRYLRRYIKKSRATNGEFGANVYRTGYWRNNG